MRQVGVLREGVAQMRGQYQEGSPSIDQWDMGEEPNRGNVVHKLDSMEEDTLSCICC